MSEQVPAGERLVKQFVEDGNPLAAAFWIRSAENGESFLYLVTDLVDQQGPTKTYGLVDDCLAKIGPTLGLLSLDEVKVVSPNDSVARAVREIADRRPGRLSTHVHGARSLGLLEVDYLYIYGPLALNQ